MWLHLCLYLVGPGKETSDICDTNFILYHGNSKLGSKRNVTEFKLGKWQVPASYRESLLFPTSAEPQVSPGAYLF